MGPDDPALHAANPHRLRRGLSRIWHATLNSLHGFRAACAEPAFRQELLVAAVLLPMSFWLGRSWVEVALLAGSVLLVMVVELLNTAVESAIDRIGLEWHPLSKRAKDVGSAAVMLSLLLAGGIWLAALLERFG